MGEGMKHLRGRRSALLAVLLALSSIGAAGYTYRDRLAETYWIWRLDAGERREQTMAALKLGDFGSTRAVKALLEKWCRDRIPPIEDSMESSIQINSPIYWSMVRIGPTAYPALRKALLSDISEVRREAQEAVESIQRQHGTPP